MATGAASKPYARLLAKSTATEAKPAPAETLQGHTSLVVQCARQLLGVRLADSLDAAALDRSLSERARSIVECAAFVHDLGKCSLQFQQMVRAPGRITQLLRHELLSLWLCWEGQPLHGWLRRAVQSDEDYRFALLVAAGHHRKFFAKGITMPGKGDGDSVELLVAHKDFADTLRLGATLLKLGDPPVFGASLVVPHRQRANVESQLQRWQIAFEETFDVESSEARLLAVCKALMIASDVAGSALPKSGERPSWVSETLESNVARGAFDRVVEARLGENELRLFQVLVGESDAPVTFVRAGCGTGKTLAAYQWAARQHPHRQLWVTYPTTGTTTEGFRDYIFNADVTGRLEHGRSLVDYELFSLYEESDRKREQDRLDSLRAWGCDAVTCTVDTVLGLVQNHRKGHYMWPGLSRGAVVFDEIHSYDDELFGSLLRFLAALPGVPALLMTASLPEARLRALRAVVERAHGRALNEIAGPTELEQHPRYTIESGDVESASAAVEEVLRASGKVLWVSNIVAQCMAVARRSWSVSPAIYHSRFRYMDRVNRHGAVIEAFRGPGPAFATSTQVAEMSLDLSADLLVTELAPIPAMIQRLGRLNRRSTPENPQGLKRCIVIPPSMREPYEQSSLDEASAWVCALGAGALSQRSLVEAWKQLDETAAERTRSEWIDGGFITQPGVLRESSPGMTVLLARDADALKARRLSSVKAALPMNRPPAGVRTAGWEMFDHIPIAPESAIDYDEMRGGQWRR